MEEDIGSLRVDLEVNTEELDEAIERITDLEAPLQTVGRFVENMAVLLVGHLREVASGLTDSLVDAVLEAQEIVERITFKPKVEPQVGVPVQVPISAPAVAERREEVPEEERIEEPVIRQVGTRYYMRGRRGAISREEAERILAEQRAPAEEERVPERREVAVQKPRVKEFSIKGFTAETEIKVVLGDMMFYVDVSGVAKIERIIKDMIEQNKYRIVDIMIEAMERKGLSIS